MTTPRIMDQTDKVNSDVSSQRAGWNTIGYYSNTNSRKVCLLDIVHSARDLWGVGAL